MRLAIDVMGGDWAPSAAVEGALAFLEGAGAGRAQVWLVGDTTRVQVELSRLGRPGGFPGLSIRHVPRGARSISRCLALLKSGEVDAMVSAGDSAELVVSARAVLGCLPGISRPAIAAQLPTLSGRPMLMLDVGANVACRAAHLVEFAHLGAAWVRSRFAIARPRVALLSNGSEPNKGTREVRSAAKLLGRSGLEFIGPLEGNELFLGSADVVVVDGFCGNLVLKSVEGALGAVVGLLRGQFQETVSGKLDGMPGFSALGALREKLDWTEQGGAPMLGIRGACVVAHGRSNAKALASALGVAMEAASLAEVDALLEAGRASAALLSGSELDPGADP